MIQIRFSTHIFVITLVILLSIPYIPQSYAASCSSRDTDRIEGEYDDARDDFDEELDDSDLESDLEDIRQEIDRGRSAEAVDAALRRAQGDINDLEEEGDSIHDNFLELADESRFEDCDDEVDEFGDDLRRYIRDEIGDLQDTLDDLNDESDSNSRERKGAVRAPTWHWGEETPEEDLEDFDTREDDEEEERTAEEITEEIKRLFLRIQKLLIELAEIS